MNKLTIKIATAVSSAALIVSSFATPLLATTVEVTGNGANSESTAEVTQTTNTTVTQTNDANISNNVSVSANTGGNDANKNTGGDVSIKTGDSSANVEVANAANSNKAEVSGCCASGLNVKIAGNGAYSENEAEVKTDNKVNVDQDNTAKINNKVYVDQNTGYNDANKNTGGDVAVETGDASATVSVSNEANSNWAAVTAGPNGGGVMSVEISGNGANSENEAEVSLSTNKNIDQNNYANIGNLIGVESNTGNNDANKNTGGEVSIKTGDADANVEVSNKANFNAAHLEGCGCISDLLVKIAGNGADSENKAKVKLSSEALVDQDNTYNCGGYSHGWGELSWGNSSKNCADVEVGADTGNNDVNSNTTHNGDPSVQTGDASADVKVDNMANENIVGNIGDLPGHSSGSSSLLLLLLAFFS